MNTGLSNQVRSVATSNYVQPARASGHARFSIRVKDLLEDLKAHSFPPSHVPQVCGPIQTKKFLNDNDLEIERVDGPPSGLSTTVVVHYRFRELDRRSGPQMQSSMAPAAEDAKARAKRLTDKLRGLLRSEMAAYGGGEKFLRWIRSEDEKNA